MDQIVHIFRKDVRRHWLEIAVSLAVLVAYASYQSTPGMASTYGVGASRFLLGLLAPLVVIAWALLIVRVVQDECLVGDRQFWVTRPYEWKELLVAKLFFIIAFVNVPLLILQVFLLVAAGFSPAAYLTGLLRLQLWWTLLLILPAAALAAITASIGQSTLVVLGVLLYAIALGVLSSAIPNSAVGAGWVVDSIEYTVIVSVIVAVVLWQYARRRTAQSRVLLLGVAAALPIITLVTPYRALIARAYPEVATGQQMPVELRFDLAKLSSRQRGYPEKNKVHIRIPLLVSGVTEGSAVLVAGTLVNIQAPDGERWSSNWQGTGGLWLQANRPHEHTDVTMDKNFFERAKSATVKVHISFALAPARAQETTRIVARPGGFALPGDGRCLFSPLSMSGILCLFPLKTPSLLISARSGDLTCPPRENEKPLPSGMVGYEWIAFPGAGSVEFGISPVQSAFPSLSDWGEAGGRNFGSRDICPGTSLTVFGAWEQLPRARIQLDIESLRLADYQLNDSPAGEFGGFGVTAP